MFRIVISGLAAVVFGLCSGWLLLAVMSVEASPTTGPAAAWSPSQPFPASPASVPSSAPRIRTVEPPAPTPAPVRVTEPQAEPTPSGVTLKKRRIQLARQRDEANRIARQRDDDDDDD